MVTALSADAYLTRRALRLPGPRQRHDAALVGGPCALERDDPDVRPGDQVGRKVVEADLDQLRRCTGADARTRSRAR
jgi:hypothetical protein